MRGPIYPPKGDFLEQQKVIMKISSKIFLIIIYLFVITSSLFAQNNDQHLVSKIQYQESGIRDLVSEINKIISDRFFDKTQIAIDIFDLTDSVSLYQKNNKLLLRPASNMKLLTSAAALLNLGEYYAFRTDLYHTGVIESDTLFGDVYVVGGFDPLFTSEDLDSLVKVIKSLGIKIVTGGVCGDISKKDSMYWGRGWMWDDDPEPSAPYLSALNINGNSIEVYIESGEADKTAIVKLIPDTKYVEVENKSVTVGSAGPNEVLITRDWVNKRNTILVSGKVNNAEVNYSEVNVLHPERYFLTLFKEHLERELIYIDKAIDVKRLDENSVYITSLFRSIDTVLSIVNKDSDNLSAEMLIYALAYKDSGAPAEAEDGLATIRRLIDSLGLNSNDYSIADGSGVSHYNLITAELLLGTLKYMYYSQTNLFEIFYNSLSIAGVDGTLKNRMKNTSAQNNVYAKTGTLNGVSNLSGYVTAKDGHLLAFSILIQNYVDESSKARSFQNKICELLAEFE
jgi:D-alanyl-D-alanine carboxypeptidase/D-alanyl-D-alanine-endopeptidase (penicillin-binding protein 4)